ncbi:MAG TPA: tripartite tricarboxylate transporter permease [Candidatus Bilamarchaeaceae archaeon]|nr:tripartite tricarboxylate transporter permease [Candidatus Bilamarchaeaceae archaeon]
MVLLAFLLALVLGLLSGLLPGLHPNTIIAIIANFPLASEDFAIVIVVVLAVHSLVSFIPSIFFGVPEQSSVVSALAGQQLVRKGYGIAALKAVLFAAVIAALLSIALFYFSLDIYPFFYDLVRSYMGYIVLALSLVLLWRSKNPFLSGVVFLVSGLLGLYSLNTSLFDPFLPLFSGLFAMAAFLTYQKSGLPPQADKPLPGGLLKFALLGVVGGFFADLLPGISSASQVAVVLSVFLPMNSLAYLSSIASISISEALFSFATAASIEKSRMGATVWLSETIIIEKHLPLILVTFLAALALAALFLYFFRKRFARLATLDFSIFNKLLALYLIVIVFLLDGWQGLLILVLASALGYVTIRLNVERRNLMGAVIVPTLLLLFKFFIV